MMRCQRRLNIRSTMRQWPSKTSKPISTGISTSTITSKMLIDSIWSDVWIPSSIKPYDFVGTFPKRNTWLVRVASIVLRSNFSSMRFISFLPRTDFGAPVSTQSARSYSFSVMKVAMRMWLQSMGLIASGWWFSSSSSANCKKFMITVSRTSWLISSFMLTILIRVGWWILTVSVWQLQSQAPVS